KGGRRGRARARGRGGGGGAGAPGAGGRDRRVPPDRRAPGLRARGHAGLPREMVAGRGEMIRRAEGSGDGRGRREAGPVGLGELRPEVLEPHASLRYVARLFKWLAAL